MSRVSSQVSQCQSVLPDPYEDHNDDDNEEDDNFWWDDYVTEFPTMFYSLLTPSDHDFLFNDDDVLPQEMPTEFIDAQEMPTEFIEVKEMSMEFIDAKEPVNTVRILHVRDKSRAFFKRFFSKQIVMDGGKIGGLPPTFNDATKIANAILTSGYKFDQGQASSMSKNSPSPEMLSNSFPSPEKVFYWAPVHVKLSRRRLFSRKQRGRREMTIQPNPAIIMFMYTYT